MKHLDLLLANFAKHRMMSALEVDMATMNVSLPEQMKAWVEDRARSGRYANASDYVRDLIRRDQERNDKIAAMQQLVDEGLASGVSELNMEAVLEAARARATKDAGRS
ncbi:antitoxin ParD1/3/4 [Stappia indica]|uniref:Antitoxin ParD1/3/4 n=2 Tax=Stappia indica TaxID=538381 RepID=A0A285TP65_9HYPH|nr:antitoxin ParD1/3/4 [Stappia indica]